MSTATLPILQAIDTLIERANELHKGIPEVTVVLGAAGYTKKSQVHGHFAPNSWRTEKGFYDHELMLSGESLKRGAEETLATLLHELAHAYAHAKKITDTSNAGRYHNKKFKEIGNEFGLELEKVETIGWSKTTLSEGTAEQYKEGLEALRKVLVKYRVPNSENAAPTKKPKKFLTQCPECLDPIQITKKWGERNQFALRCAVHDVDFEFYEEDPDGE